MLQCLITYFLIFNTQHNPKATEVFADNYDIISEEMEVQGGGPGGCGGADEADKHEWQISR